MSNPNKARGTAAETAVARWWQTHGRPGVERRAQRGAGQDAGDLTGFGPGGPVVQIKDAKAYQHTHLDDAQTQAANAGADYGVVIRRRRGVVDPGRWPVTMTLADFDRLLREAGR